MANDELLRAEHITKTFGHVRALKDASLSLGEGEIRALAGANGSGKSTLIKVLSGFYVPEHGAQLRVAGADVSFPMRPEDFYLFGIFCVHQDLGLIPELPVLDNLMLSEMARQRSLLVRPGQLASTVSRSLDGVGLKISPKALVKDLSRSDRALLALARAQSGLASHRTESGRNGVLVLDEITAFLPRHEVRVLQDVIRNVSSSGHGVIFVSHDLDEVMDSSDSVTVLRDGEVVLTAATADIDHRGLVRTMIGRELGPGAIPTTGPGEAGTAEGGGVVVSGLSDKSVDVPHLSVRRGEILGITGVLGSGFEKIPYLLFGAAKALSGEIELADSASRRQVLALSQLTPSSAFGHGVGLIPGNRREQGLFLDLEIAENLGSLRLAAARGRSGLLSWRRMRKRAVQAVETYDVVADGVRSHPQTLSGGNQQKVLLSRWLPNAPRLLLLHEPVQGVDVGARAAIIELLKARAREGVPIICATSDYELLVQLCDRALIMKGGRVRHELKPQGSGVPLDKSRLVELCISDVSEVA